MCIFFSVLGLGCFCPFYQLYLNRKSVDGIQNFSFCTCFTSLFCANWCECFNRKALAAKYNLKYNSCLDCIIGFYCSPCAIWQGLILFFYYFKRCPNIIFFKDAYEIQQRETPQSVVVQVGTTDV